MGKLPILDQLEALPTKEDTSRGVRNPRVIDLISRDSAANRVVLTMVEERSWETPKVLLEDLEEKLNSYLAYVLDGFLAQQYPQYEGLPVTFRYESAQQVPSTVEPSLAIVEQFCDSQGIKFEIRSSN